MIHVFLTNGCARINTLRIFDDAGPRRPTDRRLLRTSCIHFHWPCLFTCVVWFSMNKKTITGQPIEPPDRTANRGQRSSPANSTYINTHVTLLNAQPLTHRYAQLHSPVTHWYLFYSAFIPDLDLNLSSNFHPQSVLRFVRCTKRLHRNVM
ncbi:hypothetical protein T265_05810 [Opisthorchis viverrini]|uniref:Uncharacterized protein n=1 Tax=Opisthorchis viverrini TaxID=6198 RepID=A0A074ZJ74_OPIVI|nr:hypothetical protein T265_05810 [Opisthorchis viverrini]KER27041.1 hypothetical protein T265_05810 [Opisthorchis viverrini]